MDQFTITETYSPGDVFYACPLNNEYLKAKKQAGADVQYVGSTSDGINDDGSFTHHSTWMVKQG
ncbi:hypothetical protein [Bradyrhizobium genomosp. III]|uniref:hypothetical protein n=1 Tax=Bradyrhizobium genomosp. III TaxID=2683271 RepID=UPI00057784A7|nr:hypothetical protein [Bradyrhizobium sp. CCBAU 15544]